MPIREIAQTPRLAGTVRLAEGLGLRSAVRVDDVRCSMMSLAKKGDGLSPVTSNAAPVCDQLRVLFDEVTEEPVPDLLSNLADRLDKALASGELSRRKGEPPAR